MSTVARLVLMMLLLAAAPVAGAVASAAEPTVPESAVPEQPAPEPSASEPAKAAADPPAEAPKAEAPKADIPAAPPRPNGTMESICLILESAAAANGLPLSFFARVIWQESRFRPDAIGPMTRRGHRAQGIAQFMPYTAEERGLLDPFDPVAALPKSAEFLAELRESFGNLGLAAAAYNAGPGRVRDWMAGRSGLPAETRRYVRAITGLSAEEWVEIGRSGRDGIAEKTSCTTLAALLKQQPSMFIGELERRVREGAAQPWGVQLAAGFSRARVLASYAAIERRHRAMLDGRDPVIIRALLRSRGSSAFYQVRVGAETRTAAAALCADLSRRGAACMVLKNSRGVIETP
ncbi:Soluble lytic murein transglycosylase [Rhodoplanes serenus]|uniref:Soluble lytic murein transglycosylase n=1 Tax=Rhodoplanes serenus TaxID=200615 RepID=A0A3S4CJF9_9BRAD|nr:lytic transglycosylase domain-containing protein [Rhodoplanes serenus]VCU10709.1 Soluble lytic murein transglycosylase [Rhodoplanes serenus]